MENYLLQNLGGYAEEKEEISKIIHFLKNYNEFTDKGAYLPKGILLYGAPGTGKTTVAKIIANEANVPLITINEELDYTDLKEVIIKSFDEAKRKAPCVLLIDELDELLNLDSWDKSDRDNDVLRALLSRIDGNDNTSGVLIVATSNAESINDIDSALIRQGRIEKHIYMALPKFEERKQILSVYINDNALFKDVNTEEIARKTIGFSGSDIKALVNYVRISSLFEEREVADVNEFYHYIQQIKLGGIKKNVSKNDLKPGAYHELGHFICDYILNGNLGTVSLQSFGSAIGNYKKSSSTDEDAFCNYTQLKNRVIVFLGGLAGTEVLLNEKYSGALEDIEKARGIYRLMNYSGLFGFTHLNHIINSVLKQPQAGERYFEKEQEFLVECYEEAKSIIEKNKELIVILGDKLMKNRIINESEMTKYLKKYKNFIHRN